MKSTIKLISTALALVFITSSCSIHADKRQHLNGYSLKIKKGKHKTQVAETTSEKSLNETKVADEKSTVKPITTTHNENIIKTNVEEQTKNSTTVAEHKNVNSETTSSSINTEVSKDNISALKAFKQFKKTLKNSETKDASDSDVMLIILVILAIIIPPLAVFLVKDIGGDFWLSLILTLLGWSLFFANPLGGLLALAAIIHALLIVFDVI